MEKTFLHQVADVLIERFGWTGIQDLTLVFPMQRAAVMMSNTLQQRMQQSGTQALWAPRMMTLNELFDSACPLANEDELFTVCRLYRIYSRCLPEQRMSLDHFYAWGRQLLSDFTNIDQSIDSSELPKFFDSALSLQRLEEYILDPDVRHRLEDLLYKGYAKPDAVRESIQAHFLALWKALPAIYHELNRQMQAEGVGYQGQRMRYVLSHPDRLKQAMEGHTYCFIGFNYLLPVEKQLLQTLADNGQALFFWDYVSDFKANTKAFSFIERNMRTLPNALPEQPWGEPRQIHAVSATSMHAQAQFAAEWLKRTYKKKGETTAIVIADEGMLEPLIYALPAITLDGQSAPEQFNITKGYPLRSTHIYSAVSEKITELTSEKTYTNIQWLTLLADFVDELSQQSLTQKSNTWQWNMQREALYQTRNALQQFIDIIVKNLVPEITDDSVLLRLLLLRHLEQITLPFHGEPITDLQIMGVLETRVADFKHLLILNVEEGVLPAKQPDKSFIPYYLRKAYGLQTHDERASVYAYNFFRLLRRSEDVTLVFSQALTKMNKKAMSRFLMQILVTPDQFDVKKSILSEANTLAPLLTYSVQTPVSWLHTRQNGSTPRLSPTAIDTFIECPRRFYYHYILGLQEDETEDVLLPPTVLGTLLHEALHYLYRHYCGCDNNAMVTITEAMIDRLNTPERRKEALLFAYETVATPLLVSSPSLVRLSEGVGLRIENRVIDHYMQHILLRDRLDAAHGLTIQWLEKDMYAAVSVDDQPIRIGGRIDRVDWLGDPALPTARRRIIDYKSGKYKPDNLNRKYDELSVEGVKVRYARQTMIYCYALFEHTRQPVEPHLYFAAADLRKQHIQTQVCLDGTPVIYDAEMHTMMQQTLQQIAGQIVREKTFDMCEEKKCSAYCPFQQLCGRHPAKF